MGLVRQSGSELESFRMDFLGCHHFLQACKLVVKKITVNVPYICDRYIDLTSSYVSGSLLSGGD